MSRPLFMDFHSHVDSSQREDNSADWLLSNQSHCSSSNPLSNGDSSSETHQCSYTQLLCNDSSSCNNSIPWTRLPMEQAAFVSAANRTLISAVDMAANAPLTPKLHSQVGNQGYNSGNFLLTNQNCNNGSYPSSKVINRPLNTAFHSQVENSQRDCNSGIWLPSNQIHYSSSNPLSNGNSSSQMYQYGFPIPLDSSYDLNLSPRTEADAASCVDNQLQFTTNQAKNVEHNGLSAILKCLTDESPSKEKDEQVKLVMSLGEEAIQKYGDELLHNIVESSSAGLSTPYKEKQDLDRESDRGIDLNKTPEQKTPKRRKHRPKVIIEGKPKRTPKPATTKNSESKETQPGKRKYVRKNKQEESASQPANVPRETTDPTVGKGEKSCRRALNFGLGETINENKGKTVGQQEEMQQGNKRTFDLTLDSQVTDMGIGTNHMSKTKSSERIGLHNDLMVEIQIPGTMSNPTPSMNHMPNNYTFLPERRESTAPIATKKYVQMGNLHVTGRQVDNGNSDLCQRRCSYSYSPMHKKQKFENGGYYMSIYGMPSKVTPVEECPGNAERKGANDVNTNGFASNLNHTLLSSYIESIAEGQNNGINESTKDRYIHPMAFGHNSLKQQLSSKLHSGQEFTQSRCFSTHSTIETCNQLASSLPRKSFQPENRQVFQTCDHISAKKQTVGPTVSKSVSSGTNKSLQEQDTLYDYQQFSAKKKGLPKRTVYPIRIDDIIHQFNCLNLNGSCSTLQKKEQNALVPYKGDGAVVPYEGFEFFKKRKPRPKVELDPETNRIWNLLMGKEGSGGIEGTDNEKEKYWEEERKVFQGRVESFIARMHLVQGDRRFSQWKGSVVDSVIGVFLTQNVSDHLSSSAFMSLAARFPLKSMSDCQTQDKVGTNILVNEPEVCMTSPVDATKWHEKISSQQISMTLHESAEHQRESETSGTESKLVKAHSQGMEEEFVSFQDSFDLSVTQGTVGITSHSVSGSEVEDPTTGCNPNKIHSFSTYQEMEGNTMFRDFYHQVNGNPVLNDGSKHGHIEYGKLKTRSDRTDHLNLKNLTVQLPVDPSSNNQFESFSEESISSSFNMEKDENCKSLRNKELSGSVVNSSVQQNILWKSRETPPKDPYLSFRPDQQTNYQPRPSNGYNQPSCNSQHEGNQTFQLDTTSVTEPIKDTEPLLGKQNGSMQHVLNVNELKKNSFNVVNSISIVNEQFDSENPLVDSNSEKRLYSFGQSQNERVTNISKGKKGKGESEKKNPVDWDILRKQVQANGGKKDRNKGTMDSLDYEALIHANVKEISDAIKERGMNNMLAERIQEFLNRLVREHGSTDLEWLRDIPPDKAKDYLLSIRGLGLKSVECVRLLTLHHLAFPVDTNVGRIAVRLGWVPLQPLPESLQLHLLELYPMLESIQKYLWPRLCKLDQLTLYELHYQMITFGKVFCTKSKPNCNACPMRGECRHFASAFASARLALPGPEEKSIVSSTVPIAVEKIPTIAVNPMSLPPPENNSLQKAGAEINWCEPIIEEPATPEQEFTELSQVDIEDLFYEDPDEIPTIKLNMEEFTVTLQNYMQEKMELQEGDMSKALVALNPEAASIPTNKLKNVSRLRTEHQVYELPDSHPLLEGMDRREPDDPSPYLLAIWTPGETANSVQPPESRCGSEDQNKLCTEKTCFSCNSIREANLQTVRGTILIPCRTAMRGRFPLNGTYFQVNEMFADNDSSVSPIDVPRGWIWNLPRRTVYFGTSVSTIFKGLSTEGIQYCFWRGYVCVRGFDRKTRAPRPLMARLHFPASKLIKTKNEKTR